jgi:hypothetical protein
MQTKVLETYPALIGYDPEKFNYFVEQLVLQPEFV